MQFWTHNISLLAEMTKMQVNILRQDSDRFVMKNVQIIQSTTATAEATIA